MIEAGPVGSGLDRVRAPWPTGTRGCRTPSLRSLRWRSDRDTGTRW